MTGTVLVEPDPEPLHTRVRMLFGPRRASAKAPGARRSSSRRRLRLVISDPRRFGTGELLAGEQELERFFASRLGLEPFDGASRPRTCARSRGTAGPRSRRCCSTSDGSPGSATSTPTRRCIRAGIHPLRAAGTLSGEQLERLREGVIGSLSAGHRRARGLDRRLPPRGRRAGLLPGPVPGAPARGRAVRAVRHHDRQDPRRREGHLRVRDLPAPAATARRRRAGSDREQLLEADRSRRRPGAPRSRRAGARRR